MHHRPSLAETCEQILREQEPNFLRLYLNPHVAQTCFCLDRYVRTTWPVPASIRAAAQHGAEDCQSFLANGLEEALSGAIKLVRYSRADDRTSFDRPDPRPGRSTRRLRFRRSWREASIVQFLPGLRVVGKDQLGREPGTLSLERAAENGQAEVGDRGHQSARPGRGSGRPSRQARGNHPPARAPSHSRSSSPASTARAWPRSAAARAASSTRSSPTSSSSTNRSWTMPFPSAPSRPASRSSPPGIGPAKSTFHSTTFQPNTISTRHFMNCLAQADPDFHGRYRDDLQAVLTDLSRRGDCVSALLQSRALSAHPRGRIRHEGRSGRRLVHRRQRPLDLRCRRRSRLQHPRPQSRHLCGRDEDARTRPAPERRRHG